MLDEESKTKKHYDYIIAGTGLAGLALACRLASSSLCGKRVLLIDRQEKKHNDRTWCFWATADEKIPEIAFKTWYNCRVMGDNFEKLLKLDPYEYKMIRGIDFYNYARQIIQSRHNWDWVTEEIKEIDFERGIVNTSRTFYQADLVFRCYYDLKTLNIPSGYITLIQHFKGWVIRTPSPAFDPHCVTLMDFRTRQHGHTRFYYVLPFSKTEALVEYTVFSPGFLPMEEYDIALEDYIKNQLNIHCFDILETEFNGIPMTNYPFEASPKGKVISLGSIAGFVKPSSGYAFKRTWQRVDLLVENLERQHPISAALLQSKSRFRWYDAFILTRAAKGKLSLKTLFSKLFLNLPDYLVFKFLEEKTNLKEEARILWISFLAFIRN